jgi:hypothetical protein
VPIAGREASRRTETVTSCSTTPQEDRRTSSPRPFLLPLFTGVRGIGFLGSPRAAWAETEARVAGSR